ncbi:MAG: tetratricopeptide repeat protein [Sandaracinaceae bacterium]
MIDDDPSDDLDLRGRLAALADEGAPRLDDLARARVLDRVEREGPRLLRQRRFGWIAGTALLAAAAAAVLFVALRSREPVASGPACEGWLPATAALRAGRLDLGRRGLARVEGDVSLSAPDGCTTELTLEGGSVDVRADDLGGGTLRVLADDVTVEVWGTRFTVTRDADEVSVDVAEGHVVVRASSEREIHLRVGERWSRGAPRAEASPSTLVAEEVPDLAAEPALPEATTEEASPAVAPVVETPAPRPRIDDRALLAEAERRWREDDRDGARAIFQRVGAGRGHLAEAAWIRLARLELRAGEPARARTAVETQRRRFPRSRLAAEALYLAAEAARRSGDEAAARAAVRELLETHPDSPQARAAQDLE